MLANKPNFFSVPIFIGFWVISGFPPFFILILPPPLYLLTPESLLTPILFTADFLNTNSPGSSMAGTVSPLPLPGTNPPLAIFLPPILPPKKPMPIDKPFPAANIPNKGRIGVIALANAIRAEAKDRTVLAIALKPALFETVRIRSANSSLTLVS